MFRLFYIYSKKYQSPKMRVKIEGTHYETETWKTISWQDITYNCTFLKRVSFNQHEEFQISHSLKVQFSELAAKIYFFVIYNHRTP